MTRRLGCGIALGVVSLTPGVGLIVAGLWVRAQGGGTAVLTVGAGALGLGGFVLLAIGAHIWRMPAPPAEPPRSPGA